MVTSILIAVSLIAATSGRSVTSDLSCDFNWKTFCEYSPADINQWQLVSDPLRNDTVLELDAPYATFDSPLFKHDGELCLTFSYNLLHEASRIAVVLMSRDGLHDPKKIVDKQPFAFMRDQEWKEAKETIDKRSTYSARFVRTGAGEKIKSWAIAAWRKQWAGAHDASELDDDYLQFRVWKTIGGIARIDDIKVVKEKCPGGYTWGTGWTLGGKKDEPKKESTGGGYWIGNTFMPGKKPKEDDPKKEGTTGGTWTGMGGKPWQYKPKPKPKDDKKTPGGTLVVNFNKDKKPTPAPKPVGPVPYPPVSPDPDMWTDDEEDKFDDEARNLEREKTEQEKERAKAGWGWQGNPWGKPPINHKPSVAKVVTKEDEEDFA